VSRCQATTVKTAFRLLGETKKEQCHFSLANCVCYINPAMRPTAQKLAIKMLYNPWSRSYRASARGLVDGWDAVVG